MIKTSLIAVAIAAGTLGAVTTTPAAAQAVFQVQVAPPPPRVEVVPAPRRGQVWVPGYWDWRGHRHVWAPAIGSVHAPASPTAHREAETRPRHTRG